MDLPDVDNTEEFRCISLCSGYAGLELGVKRAVPSLRTVCYVEVEAFACCNLIGRPDLSHSPRFRERLMGLPAQWTDLDF